MIFSNTKIKAKSILVRFYNYSDSERGYGDAGTAGYFRIKLSSFIEVENARDSGSKYYTYRLTDEAYEKIQKVLGKSWGYGIGYDKGSQTKRRQEITSLRKTLSRVERVPII
jgi:hypothetical protein